MENKPLNILISAYACGPNWGSEIGMGWHWVTSLSNYCQLYVITEKGFKEEIEKKLPGLNLKYPPIFFYNDVGEKARRLFWKQGSFTFYKYYRKWQEETYILALEILKKNKIDVIHQLNMIGFREPGFLWRIDEKPFILGPLGGIDTFPLPFLEFLPLKNKLFTIGKNIYSNVQFNHLKRFSQAGEKAIIIYAATNQGFQKLNNKFGDKVILLNETGCESKQIYKVKEFDKMRMKLLWVGRLEDRKALPLALKTLNKLKHRIDVDLTIVGDGPLEEYCKSLSIELGIENLIKWKGRIGNDEVQDLMRESTLFFFTSLREGTPHVVTEAIQNGLPVICHNACGQGSVINDKCGVRIPMINPGKSINEFTNEILKLYNKIEEIEELSKGALNRSKEILWDIKAKNMYNQYRSVLYDL